MSIHEKRLRRYFKPKDCTFNEVCLARTRAERQRKAWERKFGMKTSRVHVQAKAGKDLKKLKSGVQNVLWDAWADSWDVQFKTMDLDGLPTTLHQRFKPSDLSDDAIERARLEAIEFRNTQRERLKRGMSCDK